MMNNTIRFNRFGLPALVLVALALAAVPSFAQTAVDICATTGSVTMPDSTVVQIWGYADITGGGPCGPGLATLPGPEIRTTAGETLTINLTNNLPQAVSFFVPGMRVSSFNGGSPGFFTQEAAANGGAVSYEFTPSAGTYLYQSATQKIRTQMPMGLYGALVVDQAPSMAYTDVPYYEDQVIVFSEIDPALNANPGNFGGARVINWTPQYFLINGQTYDSSNPNINLSTNQDILLRFVNAGLDTVYPTLSNGLYLSLKAEDSHRYPQPIEQYGIELQAGKTIDAILNVTSDGSYKLYDRGLNLANGTNNGGMVAILQANAVGAAPTAVADDYSVDEDGSLTADGIAPNPAGVLANDTGGVEAVLVSDASSGTLSLAGDGTFTYTPNANFFGSDQFTYVANDGAGGPNSNVATVAITVNGLPDAPVAMADAYSVVAGEHLIVAAPGVLSNDSDPDGDDLTAQNETVPNLGSIVLNGDGSFDFNATGLNTGDVAAFDYDACDPGLSCATTTVTISVVATPPPPANIAPTANDDTTSTPRNTPLVNYETIANDDNGEGNFGSPWIDATSVVITTGGTTQAGGTVVNNGDGTITYSPPNPGYRGTDTFQYTVEDDPNGIPGDHDGLISNVATVHINVVK